MSTREDLYGDDAPTRRAAADSRPARVETRDFARTSEFWMVVVLGLAILAAGSVVGANGDNADVFRADKVWLYLTILGAAYVISRGMAKAGAPTAETDRLLDRDERSHRAPLGDRVKAAAHALTDGPDDRRAGVAHDDPDTVAVPPRR